VKDIQHGSTALQPLDFYAVGVKVLHFSIGDSTSGQRAIYHSLGLTGIPIINVNNNCSTGSTALFMAHQLIQGGKVYFTNISS
jgi:sterol carrier protein 2